MYKLYKRLQSLYLIVITFKTILWDEIFFNHDYLVLRFFQKTIAI